MKKLLKILAIFVAVIIVIIVVSFYTTQAPVKAARSFLEDVKQNNFESAYAKSSKGFQSTYTAEELKKIELPGDVNDVTFHSREASYKDGLKMSQLGGYIDENGTRTNISMQLLKEDGQWKVAAYSFSW